MRIPERGHQRSLFVVAAFAMVLAVCLVLGSIGLLVLTSTLDEHKSLINHLSTQVDRQQRVIDQLREQVVRLGGDPDSESVPPSPTPKGN